MSNLVVQIQAVINTLNTIPVSGEENMKRMLGSIQMLHNTKSELEKGVKTGEAHFED